ncbi:MAG: gliding motility protein GldN [Saprospiraceae bacterium]|nr:gliding motility protein GldN [Saprospiraceae bacterium]
MKKYCLIIIILSLILGINESSYSQTGVITPNHDPYVRSHNAHRTPLNYSPLREADVFWQKKIWRIIDFREKINHPFYYPTMPVNGRKSFMSVVFDGVKSGEIKAYAFDIMDDQFYQELTPEEVIAKLRGDTVRTTWVNPDDEFDERDTFLLIATEPADVKKIQIKEEWYFDKQRSVMDVRIIGLLPLTPTKDQNGDIVPGSDDALFWIYFPQARNVFANAPVYNRGNDAKRITYDDLFAKRMFGSYITKEQNVYDRTISSYTQGLDALLESERIKEEIFIKEHDLWEF